MKVIVYNLLDKTTETYEGDRPTIYAKMAADFPWYDNEDTAGDVDRLVELVARDQYFQVQVEHDPLYLQKNDEDAQGSVAHMLGHNYIDWPEFKAAAVLAGDHEPSAHDIRVALMEHEQDRVAMALMAYGLPVDDEHRESIQAILDVQELTKGNDIEGEAPVQPQSIEAFASEGEETAEAIRRAFKRHQVFNVKLKGKHSSGSMIAKDPDSHKSWLIKPGSTTQSPALGAQEDASSQSQREAAFYYLAKAWNLDQYLPQCDLLLVDGSTHWAVMELIPKDYLSLQESMKANVSGTMNLLNQYRLEGTLHRWGALDFVGGNTDRHGDNEMVDDEATRVYLIDHGSCFAGKSFDPARDKSTFIPYYLRPWSTYTNSKLQQLSLPERVAQLPDTSREGELMLAHWLKDIHADSMKAILHRYGINPEPELQRLAQLKRLALAQGPSKAVNLLWAGA